MDIFKHDTWAATALYAPSGNHDTPKVIVKFNRRQRIGPIPMGWLGRRLARREATFLKMLADVPHIPRDCGSITAAGAPLDNAVGHWFIEGHPMRRDERVDDAFFDRLAGTLREVHRRGIAYIDLHKRENVIVADDGSPCLIDFQICLSRPAGVLGNIWPISAFIRTLQNMDDYHILKHMLRLRPDLVPESKRDLNAQRPAFVRLCRTLGDPPRWARRRLLRLLNVRGRSGMASTEVAPEDAFREADHVPYVSETVRSGAP